MDKLNELRSRTRAFNPVNYLETPEDMAAHLQAAFLDGDPRIIAAALGNIARARGMAQLANETGLTRENLYVALSEKGNPRLDTLMKVLSALGIGLVAVPGKASRGVRGKRKSASPGNDTVKGKAASRRVALKKEARRRPRAGRPSPA